MPICKGCPTSRTCSPLEIGERQVDGWLFEGVDGRFLKAEDGPLADGGVPGVRAPAKPRRLEEAGFEPELHDIIIGGAVLRGDCACQSSGSLRPPLNRGDRGKAGEGVLADSKLKSWLTASASRNASSAASLSSRKSAASPIRLSACSHIEGCCRLRATGMERLRYMAASASQPLRKAELTATQYSAFRLCALPTPASSGAASSTRVAQSPRRCPPRALAPKRPSRSSTHRPTLCALAERLVGCQPRLVGPAAEALESRRSYRAPPRGSARSGTALASVSASASTAGSSSAAPECPEGPAAPCTSARARSAGSAAASVFRSAGSTHCDGLVQAIAPLQ